MQIIDDTTFSLLKDSEYPLVLVDFYADWCGPCRTLTPVLEKLSNQYPEVAFCKLNIDDNPESAQKCNIASIPTIILFKNGQPVEKFVGVQSERVLSEAIIANS